MAASDFFLVIDTITGETEDSVMKAKGAMHVESFSWGLSNAGTMHNAGGGGKGKSAFQDIHFVKNVDKASPAIALKCATGDHIAKAVLTVRKAGKEQKDYYIVTLEDVLVSSFQAGASAAGDATVVDQFSLNFAKIKWEYKVQDVKGVMTAGGEFAYDIKQNTTK